MVMARHRFLIGAVLIIIGLNLCYRILRPTSTVSVYSTKNEAVHNASFVSLLPVEVLDDRLFVIDPFVLSQALGLRQMSELGWRFNVPKYSAVNGTLTMAMFGHHKASFSGRADVTEVVRVKGQLPFSQETELLHLFLNWRGLNVHVVVLHQVKHFLWIGQIPESLLTQLQKEGQEQFKVHFGKHEEIYDPFGLNRLGKVQFPNEISHFLGQMPTSRYMRCPGNQSWLIENKVAISESRIASTEEAIIAVKSLMKSLEFEFFMVCGTLLGWFRQCHVTPYTNDVDFSTWAKYLEDESLTERLKTLGPKHNLRLYYRFGEPTRTMEYSLITANRYEKADMFFIYPNGTHFLLPYHIVSKRAFAYSIYPKYQLCSSELLGYKLLAPCDPEKVILAEYGPKWSVPLSSWSFSDSPLNSGPQMPYTFEGTQVEEFSPIYRLVVSIFLVVVILLAIYVFLVNHCTRIYTRLSQK